MIKYLLERAVLLAVIGGVAVGTPMAYEQFIGQWPLPNFDQIASKVLSAFRR